MPSADHKSISPIARSWWRRCWSRIAPLILVVLLSLGLRADPASAAPANTAPALAITAATASTAAPSCAPISRSEVEGLFDHWNAELASGDAARVAALYSDDALLLPTLSNQPRDTPAGIRDYFEGFLARAPRGRIDSRRISLGCNAALDAGTYSFQLTGPGGAGPEWVQARYTFVYVHGPDGWRIQHHHSSLQPPG